MVERKYREFHLDHLVRSLADQGITIPNVRDSCLQIAGGHEVTKSLHLVLKNGYEAVLQNTVEEIYDPDCYGAEISYSECVIISDPESQKDSVIVHLSEDPEAIWIDYTMRDLQDEDVFPDLAARAEDNMVKGVTDAIQRVAKYIRDIGIERIYDPAAE